MDVALTAADCLRKIFELREAILHQRSVNKKTYMRLTAINLEIDMLKLNKSVQGDAVVRRDAMFDKFEDAANKFVKYLEKYNGMYRVARVFRLGKMQDEHQEIIDEINELFQMLSLSTYGAVTEGVDASKRSAAHFLAELAKVHKDVKLTHEQVQAALKKMMEKDTAERKQQPVTSSFHEPVPESIAIDDETIASKPEVFHTADIDITRPKSPGSIPKLSAFDQEDEANNSVSSKTEDAQIADFSPVSEIYQEPVPEPSAIDEVDETKPSSLLVLDDLESAEPAEAIIMSPCQCLGVNETPKDSMVEESFTKTGESSQSDRTSVLQLMKTLKSCQVGDPDTELTLLLLIRMCVISSNRREVLKTEGIAILTRLVRESDNQFTQMYALHCLSWFTFSYSKMPAGEFEGLRTLVRAASRREMMQLQNDLEHGDELEKETAVIRCSCIATHGDVDTLRCVGVLPVLVRLLSNGTDNQKLWAAEALETLASNNDQNRVEIASAGAIQPLIALLRSGEGLHKQEAAYALGNLAVDNDLNRSKIAREGAIPPLVAFVKATTDAQNQWAVYALGRLSSNNEENRRAIGEEGAIPPLVELLRGGSKAQKQWAAYTLGKLAINDCNRMKIIEGGAIKPLIELLRTRVEAQNRWAAYALGNLASGSKDPGTALELKEAVLPLVELVRTGSDQFTHTAVHTLGDLAADNNDISVEIARDGAIPPLIVLLRTGSDEQKGSAAYALGCLAGKNDANRAVINESGACELLKVLVQTGTEDLKSQAEGALKNLRVEGANDTNDFLGYTTHVIGVIRDGVNSHKPRVVAALSTFGDNAVPFLQSLVSPTQEKMKSLESKMNFDAPADASVGKYVQDYADAW